MGFKKYQLITIAGFVWFTVGLALLIKGLYLILFAAHLSGQKGGPLLSALMYAFTGAIFPSILTMILFGLLLGLAKGKWAFGRAAKRTVQRIYPMRGKIHLSKLYRLHDIMLIVSMIALGRLMNWVHVPRDIHGLIDIAVGSALVNGAMIYFRYAIKIWEEEEKIIP